MIDALTEQLITLTEAAKLLPRRRRGRKAHLASMYRYTTRGLRGIVLESIQVASTRCTSKEALGRWFAALSNPDGPKSSSSSPARRRRQVEKAEAECKRAGV